MIPPQLSSTLLHAALKYLNPAEREIVFREGDMVEGRVLKILSGNQAVVRLGGVDLVASTPSKLAEGQNIVGKIESVEPEITISLLRGESARDLKETALMRMLMPSRQPLGAALARLAALDTSGAPAKIRDTLALLVKSIQQALALDFEKLTPDQARELLSRSGLFLESTLKQAALGNLTREGLTAALISDGKAALGKTLASVEGEIAAMLKRAESAKPGEPFAAELRALGNAAKTLREAMNVIELNQLLNAQAKERGAENQPQLFQIPWLDGQEAKTARLYVTPRDGGKGGQGTKKPPTLVFMLEMSALGPVRLDARMEGKSIEGAVYVTAADTADYLHGRLPELAAPLDRLGYAARFTVSTAQRGFVTEELEMRPLAQSRGMVDVRA